MVHKSEIDANCIFNFDTAKTIASSLITSKLDYCNAILSGISNYNITRLQRILKVTAKVVFNTKVGNGDALCKQLHWLPVKQRIDYKLSLLIHKTLTYNSPSYLRSLINISVPTRKLRSSENGLILDVPFTTTQFSSRAFSVYGPRLWNSLPKTLRDLAIPDSEQAASVFLFKTHLKTFLFSTAYPES